MEKNNQHVEENKMKINKAAIFINGTNRLMREKAMFVGSCQQNVQGERVRDYYKAPTTHNRVLQEEMDRYSSIGFPVEDQPAEFVQQLSMRMEEALVWMREHEELLGDVILVR